MANEKFYLEFRRFCRGSECNEWLTTNNMTKYLVQEGGNIHTLGFIPRRGIINFKDFIRCQPFVVLIQRVETRINIE
ncbi:hypothetical protein THIOM_005559 [Candidatus Thiomargarita nelsonii]|uniref:Uncharacterized protein n=1 Tax=Candidatus Thiomargarita nelsonii TaxID=1003181 RepID=A0A176RT01_9GAMM|nr:hypothetical protein THIOM_005559 [Candidatus Thiomargarita nelsonii]